MSLATMAYVYVACTICITNFSTGSKFWLVKILPSYMFLLKPPVCMCFLEGPITSLVPRMGPGNEASQSLIYIQAMEYLKIFCRNMQVWFFGEVYGYTVTTHAPEKLMNCHHEYVTAQPSPPPVAPGNTFQSAKKNSI